MSEQDEINKAVAELNECKKEVDVVLAKYNVVIVPTFKITGASVTSSYSYEKTCTPESN